MALGHVDAFSPLPCVMFAGMSLYSGFWNTYGVCAGGFEGEKTGGGWRAYILTAPYRSPAAGWLGGQHRLRCSRCFGRGVGAGCGLGCRVLGMVGEGCYHLKQCCGDAAWASRLWEAQPVPQVTEFAWANTFFSPKLFVARYSLLTA